MPELTAAAILEIHEQVWDMPTLAERHPEIIDWLAARWEVDFDMLSNVVVRDLRSNTATLFDTRDVRIALRTVLTSEASR